MKREVAEVIGLSKLTFLMLTSNITARLKKN